MPTATPLDNVTATMGALRGYATHLEARAAGFRAHVEKLAKSLSQGAFIGGSEYTPDDLAELLVHDSTFARLWLERLDEAAHMHSGGTEASMWRRAQWSVLRLAAGEEVY